MTNPLNGEEIKMPSKSAVAEHVFTFPMALAVVATLCGWIAESSFFSRESPWQRLLMHISTGTPMLVAQLGQLWHSQNVLNKMGIANGEASDQS
jgi:hypothetical protein